ncbi:hypothetical protein JTB14_034561 [Gonioctena quinquepunctata]|nr:hypothetical protein JTB14_034561 [Gonioctena quinquepunctata]
MLHDAFSMKWDIPKQCFGTTNDGNTVRRFSEDPVLTSNITGVDEQLIRRFGTIPISIASEFSINLREFDEYCSETADFCVKNYGWYYMPQSVHKVLIHGTRLIYEAVLPVGMGGSRRSQE